MEVLRDLSESVTAQHLIEAGKLVGTTELPESESGELAAFAEETPAAGKDSGKVVEHKRVWFASYAYEWPPEMLFAAAELTLELAEALLSDGLSLKDATPYNVLFEGPKPIFVDVLSFEKRTQGDSQWLPYGQFVRTFVLPLLMNKQFGTTGAETFVTYRDGLEPERVYPHTTWSQRLRSPFLTTVSIPSWLARRVNPDEKKLYEGGKPMAPDKADFILRSQFRRARKLLRRVRPPESRHSTWSSYVKNLSYTPEDFDLKASLIRRWLGSTQPASVLDVGCNTGLFSQIAAEAGARVVGIDLDPVVVGMTWRRAVAENLDILPLVVNLARPSPATGWRNAEYPSFLDRAEGSFDAVMMLAVLHHLLVTERIPLGEIVQVCRRLAGQYLIIEFIAKEDDMFQRLTRGRESLHADFTQEAFEAACGRAFKVIEKAQVKGNFRWLYLLENTSGSGKRP